MQVKNLHYPGRPAETIYHNIMQVKGRMESLQRNVTTLTYENNI